MKNFATRLFALMMVLCVLMMPVSALAAERTAGTLTIGNFEIMVDGETITLPVHLQLAGGADLPDERGYVTAKLLCEDNTALYALAALEDGMVKAYLNGMQYGLEIPLEQVLSIFESILAESGMTTEDLMNSVSSSVSPEVQAALEKVVTAGMALSVEESAAAPDFGIIIEEGAAQSVEIFDVTVDASASAFTLPAITLEEMLNRISACSPASKDLIDAMLELINVLLAESGETVTIEELLPLISVSAVGTVYTAEENSRTDITLTLTVSDGEDSESTDVDVTFMTLTDEEGICSAVVVIAENDGEYMEVTVYTDDYTQNATDYTNLEVTMCIGDAETEEVENGMMISLYTVGSEAEGTAYGIDFTVENYGDVVNVGGYYTALPAVLSEEADTYPGYFCLYGFDGYTELGIGFDTSLSLYAMPEGALLTLNNSINPLEADAATLEQLGNDASSVLIQGLMVLAQNPVIASLLGLN